MCHAGRVSHRDLPAMINVRDYLFNPTVKKSHCGRLKCLSVKLHRLTNIACTFLISNLLNIEV